MGSRANQNAQRAVPLFGARKFARALIDELDALSRDRDELHAQLVKSEQRGRRELIHVRTCVLPWLPSWPDRHGPSQPA